MIQLMWKAKGKVCQECICRIVDEYASHTGVRNSKQICVRDYRARGCYNWEAAMPRRRKREAVNYEGTECVLQ